MDRNHYAAGGGEYHMYVVRGSQTGGRGNYEIEMGYGEDEGRNRIKRV
jgi:hypothetical protein